ncbi:MAG: sterol desaturase family protein [Gemmatales bacterium]
MSWKDALHTEFTAPPELRKLGSGWVAGVLAFILSLVSLALVLVLRQPHLLGVPQLTEARDTLYFRIVLYIILVLAFLLSCICLVLRKSKALGALAVTITLVASLWSSMPSAPDLASGANIYFGLDFFILNVIFGGILFVPLERLFPKMREQRVFRTEWREDLFYYFISSMLVQIISFITLAPSGFLVNALKLEGLRLWISQLPFIVQLLAIMLLTDVVQYWVHRAFHRVPFLWKFHSVHHSAQTMDWLAGSRMHFLEILILRAATATPAFTLGFSEAAIQVYLLIVYVYASFIHSNMNWKLGWMEQYLVTPRFHHWHHGIDREAIDVNFAIHFPWLDRLFGTYHMPKDQWPTGYGITTPVPRGYWRQFLYPFRREAK